MPDSDCKVSMAASIRITVTQLNKEIAYLQNTAPFTGAAEVIANAKVALTVIAALLAEKELKEANLNGSKLREKASKEQHQ